MRIKRRLYQSNQNEKKKSGEKLNETKIKYKKGEGILPLFKEKKTKKKKK